MAPDSIRHVGWNAPRDAYQPRAAWPFVQVHPGGRAGDPVSRRVVRRGDRESHALPRAGYSARARRDPARAEALRFLLRGDDGPRAHEGAGRIRRAFFFASTND